MALKENPAMVLKKFEELKKWQKLQEEKLHVEQEAQRELLMAAQRRIYEDYNRDLGGSSRSSYNDESLHHTSLESFPRIGSPVDISPPAETKTQNGRKSPVQPCVSFDDIPVPSPHKDFNELLGEKLRQSSDDRPKEGAPSMVVKRPFLRKGEGLVKYRLNPSMKKQVQKQPSLAKLSSEKKNTMPINKPTQFSANPPENTNMVGTNGPPVATWANVLSKNPTEPTRSEQFISRSISPDQQDWTPSGSEASPNKPVGSNKLTKKELEDLRLFELLEQKAANSSFCSSSSTIIRLLEKSHQSTPNKMSARERQLTLRDFQLSPLRPPSTNDRSLHVRFADQNMDDFFQKPTNFDPSSCDSSLDSGEADAVKNVPLFIGRDGDGQRVGAGLGTIAENVGAFEDSEAWSDGCVSLASESSEDDEASVVEKTIEGEDEAEKSEISEISAERSRSRSTSPTEQLVRTAVEGVAYKSDLLRKRLQELEAEIETFRKENASLTRLKQSHELEVAKFAKEKKETERAFREKQESLMNLLDVERKKLQKDKKVFEKYYKELKSQPTKMEREEIAALKLQVENLREELAKKDSRWSATQVRTRDRLKQLEAENVTLKSQLADAKRERQAAAKRRASLPNRSPSRALDTKVIHAINTHIGRIKPGQLKDVVVSRRPQPIAGQRSALLTNRPIWGARKPPTTAKSDIRRTKSVPDVRPVSPQRARCKSAVTVTYNRVNSDTEEETDEEEEEDSDIDEGSLARVEKLRNVVYDAYYDKVPGSKATKTAVVDLTKDKENASDGNQGTGDDVPEYLTAISKKIAYYKAKLQIDEKKPEDCRASASSSNRSSLSPPRRDSYERTTESVPPVHQTTADKDSATHKMPAEVVKANGSREKTFPDGAKEVWYANGNVKKVSADRSVVKIVYFNGDVKETVAKSGLVKYYYAETKTWHSTYSDGTEILEFANGQRERRTADGVSEITFPNGCVRLVYADGRDEWTLSDGTRITTDVHGEKVARLANGQREIHTATHKRREYPDGTVKLVYPDGLQETRYANGRIRIKDKDGILVMDSAEKDV